MSAADDIYRRFKYYQPSAARAESHQNARSVLIGAAIDLAEIVPDGREKSLMMTKLEEALFWANAGIARQP